MADLRDFPAHRLGRVQKHVLLILSTRGECTRHDWAAWYPLEASQVYGAVDSLSRRGLVDVAGFDGRSRTFKLTRDGFRVVEDLCLRDEEEDE